MFYFILILIFSACNLPAPECNSQDSNSSCYINPPEIVNISSYDTQSIEIEFDENALIDFEPESIIIVRESIDCNPQTGEFFCCYSDGACDGETFDYSECIEEGGTNGNGCTAENYGEGTYCGPYSIAACVESGIIGPTITIFNDPESPITTSSPFYRDTKDIEPNTLYFYSIKFFDNEDNPSIARKDTILHEMAVPSDFLLEQQAAAIIKVSWSHTPKIKDNLNSILGFEIIKNIEDTIIVNSLDRSYTDYDIIPFTTYQYKMRAMYTNDDFSNFTPQEEETLEFPQVEPVYWYSRNLETISISIEFDEQYGWADVQMSLSRRRDEPDNQLDEFEPVFSSSLQNLDEFIDILEAPKFNERWEYMLDWWSGSYHDTVYVPIITLPSNLVYIEGTAEGETFDLLDDDVEIDMNIFDGNIEPFYVSTTETPNITSDFFGGYDAPPNFLQEYEILPKASILLGDIIQEINATTQDWYINPAPNSYSSIFSYATSGNIPDSPNLDKPGLRLLMEYEWEYLARNGGDDNYEDYSFGGVFNDASLNSYNDEDATHTPFGVGSFEPSPFGIFDLNGNVWEWCHSIEENGKYVLRGGSYQTEGDECNNTKRRKESAFINPDPSIGYRMAISAIPFIDELKNRRCEEKGDDYNGCY